MAEALTLTHAQNVIPLPEGVLMNGLSRAAVEVTADPSLEFSTTAIELEPPEAFDARLSGGTLRVDSAEGASGGTVRMRMHPDSQLGSLVIIGTGLRVSMRGTEENPLLFGGLNVRTSGSTGRVEAEHVDAQGAAYLRHETDGTRVFIGEGVTANPLLPSLRAVRKPLQPYLEEAA